MHSTVSVLEQRKHRRFPFDRRVEYSPTSEGVSGPWRAGRALDFSFGGVRILGERRLYQDDLVQIRLDSSGEGGPFVAHARVVYVRLEGAGRWLLGCEFLPSTAQGEAAMLEDECA